MGKGTTAPVPCRRCPRRSRPSLRHIGLALVFRKALGQGPIAVWDERRRNLGPTRRLLGGDRVIQVGQCSRPCLDPAVDDDHLVAPASARRENPAPCPPREPSASGSKRSRQVGHPRPGRAYARAPRDDGFPGRATNLSMSIPETDRVALQQILNNNRREGAGFRESERHQRDEQPVQREDDSLPPGQPANGLKLDAFEQVV